MNNYTKLTPELFKKALKDGRYQSLTGARRAIGKSSMNDAEKERANKFANAHFPAGAVAAATGDSDDDFPGVSPKKSKTEKVEKPKATKKTTSKKDDEPVVDGPSELDQTSTVVTTTAAAMAGLASARHADPGVDTSEATRIGTSILHKSLNGLNKFIDRVTGNQTYPVHTNGVSATQFVNPSTDASDQQSS